MIPSDHNIHDNKTLPYALYIFGPRSGLTKKSGNLDRNEKTLNYYLISVISITCVVSLWYI